MVGDLDELLDDPAPSGGSRGRSSSASTSPTGARASPPRTTGRSIRRRARDERPRPLRATRPQRGARRGGGALSRPRARGIKLHPRAQRFLPDDPRLEPVFALAAERGVPILIHGGRGLPPIADCSRRLARPPLPDADHRARRHRRPRRDGTELLRTRPGVFFDTSVWSPLDLLDLYRLSRRSRSSTPPTTLTGGSRHSLLMAIRTARAAGLDEARLRALLGETAALIADRRAAAAAVATASVPTRRAADHVRADPPVPLDGGDAALDASAGHARPARARAQRLRRALERAPRGDGADPGAARRDRRALARSRRESDDETFRVQTTAAPSGCCTSRPCSRSRAG